MVGLKSLIIACGRNTCSEYLRLTQKIEKNPTFSFMPSRISLFLSLNWFASSQNEKNSATKNSKNGLHNDPNHGCPKWLIK